MSGAVGRVGWYARRLRRMSAHEMAHRAATYARQQTWSTRRVRQGSDAPLAAGLRSELRGPVGAHEATCHPVPTRVRVAAQAAGDQVLDGGWPLLGVTRPDLADPDWFIDPVTGRRAPHDELCFRINHRDEAVTGNVKQVWELSRHHHLTQLAAAYWVSGDERYAEAVDRQLRSWWRSNPFLSGIHWTSGIELGVRLISWVWIRRLLETWPKVEDLFEHNPDAQRQLRWHQSYLAAFSSEGSSANNHAVAEDAGLLVAACALPWFEESDRWRETAARRLRRHLADNTGADGLNRELATDYHRFVTELAVVAATEARAAGHDLGDDVWRTITRSFDAAAAVVDVSGRAPRQGDGDEGRGLVLDGDADPWATLLSIGAATVGPCEWWPGTDRTVAGTVLGALAKLPKVTAGRPTEKPRSFPDAGLVLLRTPAGQSPEIWCRCDGGPHGFLSIAAHAHADALSIEVRHDGVDILADPGTYCYHGEPEWRQYFRSTSAHNTLRIDGRDQAVSGGPFMWTTRADATTLRDETGSDGEQIWAAEQGGYRKLPSGGVRHQRRVRLLPSDHTIVVDDLLTGSGSHRVELFFHLGPDIACVLDGDRARLRWTYRGTTRHASLALPSQLTWSAHRGKTSPPLGWYSPSFGERVPATTLVGTGMTESTTRLVTQLEFGEVTSPTIHAKRVCR